ELRVEVAPLVDFRDERLPGRDGALGREARTFGFLRGLLEFSRLLLPRIALLLAVCERPAMFRHPLFVDRCQRRNRAHRAREFAETADVERHPCVAAAS